MKCPHLRKPEEPKLHRWQNGEKMVFIPLWSDEPVVCADDSSGSSGLVPMDV